MTSKNAFHKASHRLAEVGGEVAGFIMGKAVQHAPAAMAFFADLADGNVPSALKNAPAALAAKIQKLAYTARQAFAPTTQEQLAYEKDTKAAPKRAPPKIGPPKLA